MNKSIWLGLFVCSLLGGCATSATYQQMTVQPVGKGIKPNEKLKGQIEVAPPTGGKDTNPLWTSQVDNDNFQKALTDSIAIAGYQPVAGSKAKYLLSAELKDLDQPFGGFTMTVKATVLYKLEATDGSTDGNKSFTIKSSGSASTSDTLIGFERLRIANEKAMLANIKSMLRKLQGL